MLTSVDVSNLCSALGAPLEIASGPCPFLLSPIRSWDVGKLQLSIPISWRELLWSGEG